MHPMGRYISCISDKCLCSCVDGTHHGDQVQPTEVLGEDTRTSEGSGDMSTVGEVDASLGAPLPVTMVRSRSSH